MVLCFGSKACGVLAPQPGIEPTPPALDCQGSPYNLFFFLFDFLELPYAM